GHVEPAVEALAVLGAHLQRGGDEVRCARVPNTEEVAQRHHDTGRLGAVPVHLQHQLAQIVVVPAVGLPAVGGCHGHPDVVDRAGPGDLGEGDGLPRTYGQPIVVAATAVPAGGPLPAV